MNEDLLRVLLEFVRSKELTRDDVKKITDNASEVLKYLNNLKWIKKTDSGYRLAVDVRTLARELSSRIERQKLDVPFVCRIYSSKDAYMFAIPGYLVRSLGINPGDLLVVSIDGVRLSGTVVGKKRLFYIQKKYWDRLNIRDKKEVNVVLEAIYRSSAE